MADLQGKVKPTGEARDGAQRIRRAALQLFRQRGFHGASVRQLAEAASMESASLYYHYHSKQAILADLFHQTMDSLIAGVGQAIAGQTGAAPRLRAAVLFHVHFHITHQDDAFVSHSELRALDDPHREAVVAKRDRYEQLFREVIDAGVAEGAFALDDPAVVTTALLMMCSGVSDWFGPQGRLSADAIARQYADLVWRMVAAPAALRASGAVA